jgi:LysM repeat protein
MNNSNRQVNKVNINRARMRIGLLALFMLISFTFGALVQAYSGTSDPDDATVKQEVRYIYVKSGDTLWSIAKSNNPDGQDIRAVILQIIRVNGLEGSVLQVGQKLILP